MDIATILGYLFTGSAVLATIILIKNNLNVSFGLIYRLIEWDRRRIAKMYHKYFEEKCVAIKAIDKITPVLDEIKKELRINSRITMRTLGSQINNRCDFYLKQGFIDQPAREQLMAEFVDYFCSNGNGNVLANVTATLQLPYVLGGQHIDVDISSLIERHLEVHNR